MRSIITCVACLLWLGSISSFAPPGHIAKRQLVLRNESGKGNPWKIDNPFKDFTDMLSNMDDVIDDFMCKRMGNGEVFYGKRKYKPSGRPNTEGKYNGMGMTDKLRIDIAQEQRELFLAKKRQREQGNES